MQPMSALFGALRQLPAFDTSTDRRRTMTEPLNRIPEQPPAERSSVLVRVLANASLLAFASFAVISLVGGRIDAALLWTGALLVFFAPALDRAARPDLLRTGWLARRADGLRWSGLALAAAGAALLLT